MATVASSEPKVVREYFNKRGWTGETRSHAEIAEVYVPSRGWKIKTGDKKVTHDRLLIAKAEGVTVLCLRVRYSDRRQVSAEFKVDDLLQEFDSQ